MEFERLVEVARFLCGPEAGDLAVRGFARAALCVWIQTSMEGVLSWANIDLLLKLFAMREFQETLSCLPTSEGALRNQALFKNKVGN